MSALVESSEVVQEAFQTLLASLTPEQVAKFAEKVQAHSPQGHGLPGNLDGAEAEKPKKINMRSPRLQRLVRARARQVSTQDKVKKRPTNSFMAFRAYCSPQFPGLTQKTKSGLIQKMWAVEPRKHFFALLARAHSELRDNHPESVSFEKFLNAVAGLLPIIPAESYLSTMGWELSSGLDGEVSLLRKSTTPQEGQYAMKTNVSVRDILEHCYRVGLVSRPLHTTREANGRSHSAAPGMTMSFAAMPLPRAHSTSNVHATMSNAERMLDPDMLQRMVSPITDGAHPPEFDFNDLRTDYLPSMETVLQDQQHAYERHPLSAHFHPDLPAVVGWDPNMIQDDFDPFSFNISEYVNFQG